MILTPEEARVAEELRARAWEGYRERLRVARERLAAALAVAADHQICDWTKPCPHCAAKRSVIRAQGQVTYEESMLYHWSLAGQREAERTYRASLLWPHVSDY